MGGARGGLTEEEWSYGCERIRDALSLQLMQTHPANHLNRPQLMQMSFQPLSRY